VPADVSDPDPLAFADAPSPHPADVAQSSQGAAVAGDPESENVSSPAEVGSPGSVYRPEWGVTNGSLLDTPKACQDLVDHAAPPDYKRQQDQMVEQRCAEMDARLDALSVDFDEEWVIGHGLRLAMMKCAESLEMRQTFADVVSAGVAKGMSEGLKHGRAQLTLTIPVYQEVRDPRNPWACKEEIGLEDAIAANINRAEQKKRSRIVCRTHGVGSAHHARSDRVPVSAPIVVPQGLAILLVNAAMQTESDDT
nr:hypothetical protein [Tanacetum cinerariifolium]